MKVLHISNVKNLSGWSKQAENHLLALHSAGIDVSARHINILNNENKDLHPIVQDLLKRDCKNPDIVILNTLPPLYERQNSAKYCGYYVCETSNFKASGWSRNINLMDQALVPCFSNKQSSIDSGVTIPIHVVPQAVDLDKLKIVREPHSVRANNLDQFIFYTISELSKRKNIEAILKAFHTEFSPAEPVQLLLKLTPVGLDNPNQRITDMINNIKEGLKLYKNLNRYKREFVLCEFSSEEDVYKIHQSCDCYVTTSRGEAFNIPLAEAMASGKIIVSPNHTGMDYINDKNAYVVNTYPQSCFGAVDTLRELYTSNETWREIDVYSLAKNMRSAYEKKDLSLRKQQQAKKDIQKYSFESVGQIYKKTLEEILK